MAKTQKRSISIEWEVDDIHQQLENRDEGVKLSDAECMEILEAAKDNHDATIGINWDVLDYHIDAFLSERDV